MKVKQFSSRIDQYQTDPNAFSMRIAKLLFRHLKVYYAWSIFNTLACLPFLIFSSGSFFYFMLMNFVWGLVNTGFSALFYWHIKAQHFLSATIEDQIKIKRHICKMLMINIMLDMAYVLVGIGLLIFYQESIYRMMLMPFGVAIILQGLFLFIQDIWFFTKHQKNYQNEKNILNY